MPRAFARRLADIQPFHVMAVLDRAKALEAAGRDIVHLEIGEPDFTTAAPIVAAAQAALEAGATQYTQALGMPALREAIARWYADHYGVDVPAQRIVVTPGASGALLLVSALLLNPGDTMLMADPGYPCNRHFLRLVEGAAQLVPVDAAARFQLTAPVLAQHWQSHSAGAMVASPANPTGEILSRDQLAALAGACREREGYLVVDEIYHGLTYGTEASTALAVADDVFVINSFSKYFGMTGWRVGWLVAPESAVPALERLAQNVFIASPTVAQHAALAAFSEPAQRICRQRRDEFARRRDYLLPALRALGFEISHTPAGAFYLYANIEKFSDDSQQFCLDLLEQQGVAITPGVDFGRHRAEAFVRFAYTTPVLRLEQAVQRIAAFVR